MSVLAGVAVDSAGNLFIADTGNGCIRRVSPAGIITTVAGNGTVDRRWTWADRPGLKASAALPVLLKFHATNGAVSLGGNLVLMWVLAGIAGLPAVLANLISIAACALLNFSLSDRVVFLARPAARPVPVRPEEADREAAVLP